MEFVLYFFVTVPQCTELYRGFVRQLCHFVFNNYRQNVFSVNGWLTRKYFGLSGVQPNLSKSIPPFCSVCQLVILNMLTLLAPTQSSGNMFHSFTVLYENDNFLISNQHCCFANVTSRPMVLLSSLAEKTTISVNIFVVTIQYFMHLYLFSSQSPGL